MDQCRFYWFIYNYIIDHKMEVFIEKKGNDLEVCPEVIGTMRKIENEYPDNRLCVIGVLDLDREILADYLKLEQDLEEIYVEQ